MKSLFIFGLAVAMLSACGNDPVTNAGYFDDDLDRSIDSSTHDDHSSNTITTTTTTTVDDHSNVTIDDHSHVTNNFYPDTVYVRDTIRMRDTVSKTVRDTVRTTDTVTVQKVKRDTVIQHRIDTVKTTVYDTVKTVQYDTVYSTLNRVSTPSPIDTLDELPDGVLLWSVIMKLSGNTLYIGHPDSWNDYSNNSYLVQGEVLDTLKTARFGRISDHPSVNKVHPINKCVGIIGTCVWGGTNCKLIDFPYKVCDHST